MSKIVTNQIKPRVGKNLTIDGSVTSSTGTFSSNVSIGGTLTYDDITNVQSAGIVTAKTGIDVISNGIDAVGVITATSFSGDGSQLTGVQSGVANFVASGTIPNGQTVVINTDGTVGIVTQTTSNTPSAGSEVVFNTGTTTAYTSAVYDSNSGKVVIAYRDGGNLLYGTAIVGTVTGMGITFGSETVFNTAQTDNTNIVYDSTNQKVVIAYRDGGTGNGRAIVGTVSDTSITFGSVTEFNIGSIASISGAYDSTNDKVVFAYRDIGDDNGMAVVGTVSGTSISFGTEVSFNDGTVQYVSSTFDSTNGKVVISYQDFEHSQQGRAVVGTVSGTGSNATISFGSDATFDVGDVHYVSSTYDSTNSKVVVAYQEGYAADYGTAVVGTVTGTGITFGSECIFRTGGAHEISITYDSTNEKVVIVYGDENPTYYGTAIVGTVTGVGITFSPEVIYNTAQTNHNSTTFDSTNGKVVVAYYDVGNSDYGTASVINSTSQITNLTTSNFIGIAAEDIANGATGKVNILGGVNTSQTGLTTAQTHYVQPNGTLATTAGNPSVVAGTSISSTNLVLR